MDNPTSLNRYLYAGDDPVNFTDPSGAFQLDPACIAAILAAIPAIWAIVQKAREGIAGINSLAVLAGVFDPGLGAVVLILGYIILGIFFLASLVTLYNGLAAICGWRKIP